MNQDRLNRLAQDFALAYSDSAELHDHAADHLRRSQRARRLLTIEHLSAITEPELRELFSDSDALGFWSNKDWEFNNRLQTVGLDGLRRALIELITRAERVLTTEDLKLVLDMRGLGTLLASELLAYRFPERYWTYSENVTLPAFARLGADIKAQMPFGQKSNPFIYLALAEPMAQVREALTAAGLADVDHLTADMFLWWLKLLPEENFVEAAGEAIRRAWIFQANPKIYDLEDGLRREYSVEWAVNRFRTEVKPGDDIVFWKSGTDRGIYGLGRISSELLVRSDGKKAVKVAYLGRLTKPILVPELEQHKVLRDMGILRQAQGTNFRISEAEWAALQPLLGKIMPPDPDAVDARASASSGPAQPPVPRKLDRALESHARLIIENLIPDEAARRHALALLADYIDKAHAVTPAGWSITLRKDRVRLNIGITEVFVIGENEVYNVVDGRSLSKSDKDRLRQFGKASAAEYSFAPSAWGVRYYPGDFPEIAGEVGRSFPKLVEEIGGRWSSAVHRRSHSPGILAYLRNELGRKVPDPAFTREIPDPIEAPGDDVQGEGEAEPIEDVVDWIRRRLAVHGLSFSAWQIAAFYTALKTKPFVILSGISGTGKTKLAQHFAALMPQPLAEALEEPGEEIAITIKPYMRKYGKVIIPKKAVQLFDPPKPGSSVDVTLKFDQEQQKCLLTHASYDGSDYLSLLFRGRARQWMNDRAIEGDTLRLRPEFGTTDELAGFGVAFGEIGAEQDSTGVSARNCLFLSVRPDWRDSKSLLGYFNPITRSYEWAPFLRFLQRAARSHQNDDGLAWFVILDEMNLAHVEYYFADVLSVMESGRDSDGWTREALLLTYPDDAEGDLPPHELRLPPNLYFVGTVNVDETTHAFSPKVLDRAFTIELADSEFRGYLVEDSAEELETSKAEMQELLVQFTGDGRLKGAGYSDKTNIRETLAEHPEVRVRLAHLQESLRPFGVHFGYRVFDEVVGFLGWAEESGTYEGLGGFEAAFDAAVLMKVLPKFHGSRARLERPLRAVLAWCLDPDAPAVEGVDDALSQVGNSSGGAFDLLSRLNFRYPETGKRAARLMDALMMDGFAAFT